MSNTSRKRAQSEAAAAKPAAYMSGGAWLSAGQLAQRYGIHIRTVWSWARTREGFPQPVKLSESTTRWRKADIDAWDARREGG